MLTFFPRTTILTILNLSYIFQEGEFNPEVGMTDRELVMLPTKELNQRLREKMLSKDVQKRIKQRRRTLKNRFEYFF